MAKFSFSYRAKRFNLDVKECRNIFQKMSGLMFRRRSKPLLFVFNKSVNEPIHSFFCVHFIAVWFDGEKIVDLKSVKSWKPYILPKRKFDRLLEIPVNDKNFSRMKSILKL